MQLVALTFGPRFHVGLFFPFIYPGPLPPDRPLRPDPSKRGRALAGDGAVFLTAKLAHGAAASHP